MRRSNTLALRADDAGRVRRPAPARPVALAPASGLILPRLGRQVPSEQRCSSDAVQLAPIAHGLAAAGILRLEHLEHGLSQGIETAFSAFLSHYSQHWRYFDDRLTASLADDITLFNEDEPPRDIRRRDCTAGIVFATTDQREIYEIGTVLARLQRRQAGDGKRVYDLLDRALPYCFNSITPTDVKGIIEAQYWQGESNPSECIKDHRAEMEMHHQKDRKELARVKAMTDDEVCAEFGTPTLAMLREAYPDEWALNPGIPKCPSFEKAIKGEPELTTLCRRLALACAKTKPFEPPTSYAEEGERPWKARSCFNDVWTFQCLQGETAGPLILRWHDKEDLTQRVCDYVGGQVMQCGEIYSDICFLAVFNPASPASVAAACRRTAIALEIATLCDLILQRVISNERLQQSLRRERIRIPVTF